MAYAWTVDLSTRPILTKASAVPDERTAFSACRLVNILDVGAAIDEALRAR